MRTEIFNEIRNIKEQYYINFIDCFELPHGYCLCGTDGEGNMYYQGGALPDDPPASILKINIISHKIEEINIKIPGVRCIRHYGNDLYVTNAKNFIKFDPISKTTTILGQSGLGEEEYIFPGDFIIKEKRIFLSDCVTNKILQFNIKGKIETVYSIAPYSCPRTLDMISHDAIIIALRSKRASIMYKFLDKKFEKFLYSCNDQKEDVIILNMQKNFVDTFNDVHNLELAHSIYDVLDVAVDNPYIYFTTMRHGLVKVDMCNKKHIYKCSAEKLLQKTNLFDEINFDELVKPILFSLKVSIIANKKYLLIFVSFQLKTDLRKSKTLCVRFEIK